MTRGDFQGGAALQKSLKGSDFRQVMRVRGHTQSLGGARGREHGRVERGTEGRTAETKSGCRWNHEAGGTLGPLAEWAILARSKTYCIEEGNNQGQKVEINVK